MIREEWSALVKNKLLLVVLVAILLIPSIYAGLFLASMWDPYGELSKLPVAVVNQDQSVEYQGKTLHVGQDLAETLADDTSMDFQVMDEQTADEGLKAGTYYMVITIPQDFSQNATTLMDEEPKQMTLHYTTNPGKNYISSKLSESAMKEVKNQVTEKVTKTYAQNIFDEMSGMGDKLQTAADGTATMIDGENTLLEGSQTIADNLNLLESSTKTLHNGAKTLGDGIKDYTDGVSRLNDGVQSLASGAGTISSGAKSLVDGSGQVLDGLKKMDTSINESLTAENIANMQKAEAGLLTMNDSIQQLDKAVNGNGDGTGGVDLSSLTGAITSVGTNLTNAGGSLGSAAGSLVGTYAVTGNDADLSGAAGEIVAAYRMLAGLLQTDPTLSEQQKAVIFNAMSQLMSTEDKTAAGTALGDVFAATTSVAQGGEEIKAAGMTCSGLAEDTTLADSVTTLKKSVNQLAISSDQLLPASSKAITSLRNGMSQIKGGLENTKEANGTSGLIEGMTAVNLGMAALEQGISGKDGLCDGVSQLAVGSKELVDNKTALVTGSEKLTTGAGQLAEGAGKLSDGSTAVSDGITSLLGGTKELGTSLQNGADTIKDNQAGDATLTMFSAPINIEETQVTDVENNGHAMAAYMMSVGLWVGCLAFCLMYPLCSYKGKLKGGLQWWFSKATVAYPVAVLMAVVLVGVLAVCNGFHPVRMGETIAVAVVAGVAFMSMMYFFNVLLGKVGSFLMLIFMVLQLAGSAGTYPIEISGPLAAALHRFMPFTYTVEAFRSTISGGESITADAGLLMAVCVLFTVLTILLFEVRARKVQQKKPLVYDWLEEKGLA